MKKFLFILGFSLLVTIGVKAQDISPVPTPTPVKINCAVDTTNPKCKPVLTTQGFIDDANSAFTQLVVMRDALVKLQNERALTTAERQASDYVIAQLDTVIAIGKKINDTHIMLEEQYQKIIKIQSDIIDRLNAQLTKKKSFFDKVLGVLKDAVLVLSGVTIGRGL